MTGRTVPEWIGKTPDAKVPARVRDRKNLTLDDILDRATPEPNSGCWLWERSAQPFGHGYWPIEGGRYKLAHRMAFEISNGPIPAGLHVLHRCDVASCVNPDHLFLGTHRDNMRDCADKGRNRRPNICGKDHYRAKFTEAEIHAIRADPRPLRAIAVDYNTGKSAVHDIKTRKAWRHLT